MRIHIFDANDVVMADRPQGWWWLVFRRHSKIKMVRGPYPNVDACVEDALAACPSATPNFWQQPQPRIRAWRAEEVA
jgi:hypothetical protein